MRSTVHNRVIAAGITLFADAGYFGVTTRDLAKKAKTTEGSIYRLFKSREGVFREVVKVVTERSLDPSKFVSMLFEQESDIKHDARILVANVIHRWYDSLPTKSGRLLTQAYFVWPQLPSVLTSPYAPIDKIIDIMESTINRAQKGKSKPNTTIVVKALIMSLLNFKITYASVFTAKQEAERVDIIVQTWLQNIFPAA